MTAEVLPAQPSSGEAPPSVYSDNFPGLLETAGLSLLVSTYQANQLVLLRSHRGVLDASYLPFERPMGVHADRRRLVIGTHREVIEYFNVPDLVDKLEGGRSYDACFVLKNRYATGAFHIHDVAYENNTIFAVNTHFSNISIIDGRYSFTPYWIPPFITTLAFEDKCHLNGMAFRDQKLAYATAFGETDGKEAWRSLDSFGGIIMDTQKNAVVARGLVMPHSPRWYRDALWFLESGHGRLCRMDPASGAIEAVAKLNGLPRGLSFFKNLAFIGLSKIRKENTRSHFSRLPIAQDSDAMTAGVAVIDLDTGREVASIRFGDGIAETYDVKILPFTFPEILPGTSSLADHAYILPPGIFEKVLNK
jgi:uncharacterized protein (TIGR03032 family)